jgi:hypothetical protein
MIATRTDLKGFAFPGLRCLEEDTGMSQRSIRRTLSEIPREELEIIPGACIKGGKRLPTGFRIKIPARDANDTPDPAPGAQAAPGAQGHALKSAHENAHKNNPDPAPDAQSTLRLVSPDPAPDAHITVLEQSINRKEEERARALADKVGSLSSFSFSAFEEKGKPKTDNRPEEGQSLRYNQDHEASSAPDDKATCDVFAGDHQPLNISGGGSVRRNGSDQAHNGRGRKLKVKRRKKPPTEPTEAEVIDYCVSLGRTAIDGGDRYLDFRAKGFPPGDWRAVIDRYNLRGWLPSQKEGAQTEEESPEDVKRREEREERGRKEEQDRRQQRLEEAAAAEQKEYEQTRQEGEMIDEWRSRRKAEREAERKRKLERKEQEKREAREQAIRELEQAAERSRQRSRQREEALNSLYRETGTDEPYESWRARIISEAWEKDGNGNSLDMRLGVTTLSAPALGPIGGPYSGNGGHSK